MPTSTPNQAAHRTSRSLACGLELLKRFTPEQPERGISELASELKVSAPTAHRYASTCLELGYLEQVRTRRYRLARRCAQPGIAAIGALAIDALAEPILRELRDRTGRSVALAVFDGSDVVYVLRLYGFQRGQYRAGRSLGAGSRRPASETAAGRALLKTARADGERGEEAVAEICRSGPAAGDGELAEGPRGLAIAVLAPGERAYAIELAAPAESTGSADLAAWLGEPLQAAGTALRTALTGDAKKESATGPAR
ncbi:MAG TPA: helix-turn-helix domain-containing protein [Solirubrobacteraceae bacterium]|nr:helix-turn-helix domain-containing protein [Solirubrobacteraceae bacterium]